MSTPEFQEPELHLRDYLRVLYRRKWPALSVLVVTVAVAVIRAYLVPPVYRATTRILIERTQAQNLGLTNPMYNWDPDFYRTQIQIIQSAATADRAAKALAADESFRRVFAAGLPAGRRRTPLRVSWKRIWRR